MNAFQHASRATSLLVLAITVSLILFSPSLVLAANENPIVFIPQIGLPGFDTATALSSGGTSPIGKMVKGFYDYGLTIGGILAAVMLMAGGVLWLTSAGSSGQVGQAKNLIIGSITGLLLLFGAWIMLNTINPELLNMSGKDISSISRTTAYQICTEDGPQPVTLKNGRYYNSNEEIVEDTGNICDSSKSCVKLSDTPTSSPEWQCRDFKTLACCEYRQTDNSGNRCFTNIIPKNCPKYDNYTTYTKTYMQQPCKQDTIDYSLTNPQQSCVW